jgi:hypothetical protein
MEDIVAIAIEHESGEVEYCLTWGRIQDPVDPRPLEKLILELYKARHADSDSAAVAATICRSLQDASNAGNFYECFFGMCQERIPYGKKTYPTWRKEKRKLMKEGREIWYLTA